MKTLLRAAALASALFAALQAPPALAEGFADAFVDRQDGKLDASDWLLEKKGFLPVPILITEPAVGYGAGAALLFFRQSIGEKAKESAQAGHITPPDIFGVAVAGTDNHTKRGAAG